MNNEDTGVIITNYFQITMEDDFEVGSISLRTGQDIEDDYTYRFKNYYKLPSLEEGVIYCFDTNVPNSKIKKEHSKATLPTYKGYLLFYDENRIFLGDYSPLEFYDTYFPILFRCPERASYVRIIVSSLEDHPEGLSRIIRSNVHTKEMIRSSPKNISLWRKIQDFFDTLYISFFDTQEQIIDSNQYQFRFDTILYTTSYRLYDKFSSKYLTLVCTKLQDNTEYTVIDNFKITNFQTITQTTADKDRFFYVWFLSVPVPVHYTVSNASSIVTEKNVFERLQTKKEFDPYTARSAKKARVGDNLYEDEFLKDTLYKIIDEEKRTCTLSAVGISELEYFKVSPPEDNSEDLLIETYPVPNYITIKKESEDGRGVEYTIVSIDDEVFSQKIIKGSEYNSFQIQTVDFSSSELCDIGENCFADCKISSIRLNGNLELEYIFHEGAFKNNNIQVLIFPSRTTGYLHNGAFLENNFNSIFFNNMNDSLGFGDSLVFSNKDSKQNCSIVCSNNQQQLLISSGAIDTTNFKILTGSYVSLTYDVSGSYYEDLLTGICYEIQKNTNGTGVLAYINPLKKLTMPTVIKFPELVTYIDENNPENSFIERVVGTKESAFEDCNNLNTINFGFENSGQEFTIYGKVCINCKSLSTVNLYGTIVWKGDSHFKDCISLSSFPLKTITGTILPFMFQNTKVLSDTSSLNENITEIGESAFEDHSASFIILPKSVIEIGKSSFATKNKLLVVLFQNDNEYPETFSFQDDSFKNTATNDYPSFLTLGEGSKTSIQNLLNKYKIDSTVRIPTLKKVIADSSKKKFTAENTYEQYDLDLTQNFSVSFSGWSMKPSLSEEYIFPDMVYTVDSRQVPDQYYRVTSMSPSAFENKEYISNVSSFSFPLFMDSLSENLFVENHTITNLTFGPFFTRFGEKCCKGANKLTTISFQRDNTNDPFIIVNPQAFAGCTSFQGDSFFWNHMKYIGELAFANTGVIDLHELSQNQLVIKSFAFYNCNKLTTLPAVLQPIEIGSQCFDSCVNLTHSYQSYLDPTAYDKALNPNCVVLNFDEKQTTSVGLKGSNIDTDYLGSGVTVMDSGYLFNKCTKIEDYRVRTFSPSLLQLGIFKSESDGHDAWIRFEWSLEEYYDSKGVIDNTKTIYPQLMEDVSYTYHSPGFVPELYFINYEPGFTIASANKNTPIIQYGEYFGGYTFDYGVFKDFPITKGFPYQLIPFSEEKYHFDDYSQSLDQKIVAITFGIKYAVGSSDKKYSKDYRYYGVVSSSPGYQDLPIIIPHAIFLKNDTYPDGIIVSHINNTIDVNGITNYSVFGLGYISSKGKKDQFSKKLYLPSTFTSLDVGYLWKGGVTSSPSYDYPFDISLAQINAFDGTEGGDFVDAFEKSDSNGVEIVLSPKCLKSIGGNSGTDHGLFSNRYYVGWKEGDNFYIFPDSMILNKRFCDGATPRYKRSLVLVSPRTDSSVSTVYLPRGLCYLNTYLLDISNTTGTSPINTIWVRYVYPSSISFSVDKNCFDHVHNATSTTVYTTNNTILGKLIKDNSGKGKCTYIEMSDPNKYELPIKKPDPEPTPETTEYIIHKESWEQKLIPYEEWNQMNPKVKPYFRTVVQEKEYHFLHRTKAVVIPGKKMDFTMKVTISKGKNEVTVTFLNPEYNYLNLRYHPFVTYHTTLKNGKIERGVPLGIDSFGQNCCQSETLEVIHFAFTTKRIKKHAFVTPNLKHVLLNWDLQKIEEEAILMNAPEVTTKVISYQIRDANQNRVAYEGIVEFGFKTIYIPHGIQQLYSNSIVAYKGFEDGVPLFEEKPESLRKLMWSSSLYQSIAKGEPYMKNGYICSLFHEVDWIRDTYEESFEDLNEEIVCDDNGCLYHIQTTPEGENIATLYRCDLQRLRRKSKENSNILSTEEIQDVYPNNTFFIPQYLISFEDEKNIVYTVVGIEENAFQGCDYFKKVRIPSSVIYLGSNIFKDCLQLSSVEYCCFFPEKLTIQEASFYTLGNTQFEVYVPKYGKEDINLSNIFTKSVVNPFRIQFLYKDHPRGLPLNLYIQ